MLWETIRKEIEMKRVLIPVILALALLMLAASCYAGTKVYVVRKPPPLKVEVVGVAPSVEHVWVQGHWVWKDNDYQWVTGHWDKRPHAKAHWVTGHWKSTRHGYYWVPGHWK
jgi:hypothetical protein